jgi:hypothetical protein
MIDHIKRMEELFIVHVELRDSEEAPENWDLADTIEWLCETYSEVELDDKFEHISGYWLNNLSVK